MKPKENLVTKDKLKVWVNKNPANAIGKALVAIFRRQVADEQKNNSTSHLNGIGFSSNDARIGSLGAKYFMKHKTLEDWQLKPWIKDVKGYPRICKYTRQLNEIANEKEARRGLLIHQGVPSVEEHEVKM